jgi:hypothetical protein
MIPAMWEAMAGRIMVQKQPWQEKKKARPIKKIKT